MTDLVAVVDLGSNAARFTLARITPGREFRVLREDRAQTRLGAGRGNGMPPDAIASTVRATRRFLRSVAGDRSPRVVAIATAAVREASNAGRLRSALRRTAGIELEILSGEDEARLGAVAALASLPVRDGLVLDLGGGSAQLTSVRHGTIRPLTSVPLGAVRLTRRCFRHDPPSPAEIRAARRLVRQHLNEILRRGAGRFHGLVGQGGTIRTLARIHLKATPRRRRSRVHGLRLERSDITALRETLAALPLRRRRRVPGLKAERADIIVAGAVAVEEIMTLGGYTTLTVCEHGVRHGLLIRETFSAVPCP
jgi:exopolyphosphatase/guanosine-5'-triphosphate,3'-diphosphate pyrophosphatase